jgi:hypothetical protein
MFVSSGTAMSAVRVDLHDVRRSLADVRADASLCDGGVSCMLIMIETSLFGVSWLTEILSSSGAIPRVHQRLHQLIVVHIQDERTSPALAPLCRPGPRCIPADAIDDEIERRFMFNSQTLHELPAPH